MQVKALGLIFLIIVSSSRAFSETQIRIHRDKLGWTDYMVELTERILKVTEDPKNPDKIIWLESLQAQERLVRNVSNGSYFDVIWTMTSREREDVARPLRMDIFKGVMGYRVLMVRKGDSQRFAEIKTIQDLMRLTFIQGHDYPDTPILRVVGLNVDEGSNYEPMISMLKNKRVDAFPRGMTEPWVEMHDLNMDKDVEVEPHLMIAYHAPCYFFFSKKDSKFYDRFARGFQKIREDGTFDEIFNKHYHEAVQRVNLAKRFIFYIDNPFLSDESKAALVEQKKWLLPLPLNSTKQVVRMPIIAK
jgi:hypothetical protein